MVVVTAQRELGGPQRELERLWRQLRGPWRQSGGFKRPQGRLLRQLGGPRRQLLSVMGGKDRKLETGLRLKWANFRGSNGTI